MGEERQKGEEIMFNKELKKRVEKLEDAIRYRRSALDELWSDMLPRETPTDNIDYLMKEVERIDNRISKTNEAPAKAMKLLGYTYKDEHNVGADWVKIPNPKKK